VLFPEQFTTEVKLPPPPPVPPVPLDTVNLYSERDQLPEPEYLEMSMYTIAPAPPVVLVDRVSGLPIDDWPRKFRLLSKNVRSKSLVTVVLLLKVVVEGKERLADKPWLAFNATRRMSLSSPQVSSPVPE